jgi:NAD(P)-dependent dehydrogenase (short-subunit alcohol dehydrogenase family)
MGKLDGRIAVVTGAASGLGRAIALRLAQEGAQLGLIDLKDQAETLRLLREQGGQAEAWSADVSDEAQVNSAFAALGGRFDRIDVLVNNAGILSGRKPWYEHTKAEVERFLAINYVGYFLVTKAAYPLLKRSQVPARIINIASRTFFSAPPGQMAYIASKGAVIGMTRVLARELGEEGITVNALMPGQVATPGTMEFTSEDVFERTMQAQAIKQRGQPEDLANLVAFIASDDARLITGQTIIVDGGGFMH